MRTCEKLYALLRFSLQGEPCRREDLRETAQEKAPTRQKKNDTARMKHSAVSLDKECTQKVGFR